MSPRLVDVLSSLVGLGGSESKLGFHQRLIEINGIVVGHLGFRLVSGNELVEDGAQGTTK